MPVTMKDMSRELKISRGTISKVLSGKYKQENVRISPKTVRRIQAYAKKVNYKPNFAAKILTSGKTWTIGIHFPILAKKGNNLGFYHMLLIDTIHKQALEKGYEVLMINNRSPLEEFEVSRIDGLIIIEQTDEGVDVLKELKRQGRPFVIINNLIKANGLDFPTLNVDNKAGVAKVVEHFVEYGHTDLAFIGDPLNLEHEFRLEHFRTELRSRGLPVHEDLFWIKAPQSYELKPGISYARVAYIFLQNWFKEKQGRFTGIFCADDYLALNTLEYLFTNSIRIPDEMSIIGYDNLPFTESAYGGITTINQPLTDLGVKAVETLMSLMGKNQPEMKTFMEIEPELMIRHTVKKLK